MINEILFLKRKFIDVMDWFVEKFVLKKYVKESGLSSFMENYMDIDFMSLLIFYSLNDLYIDMLFFLSF